MGGRKAAVLLTTEDVVVSGIVGAAIGSVVVTSLGGAELGVMTSEVVNFIVGAFVAAAVLVVVGNILVVVVGGNVDVTT